MSDRVQIDVADGVAHVRLNRPDKMNALDGAMFSAIADAGETVAADRSVRAVVPRADPRSRTFPVKVVIPNPGGDIGVGMLATVRLPVGEATSAVMVPKDALVDGVQGSSVYVIGGDDTVRPVSVTTGGSQGAWIAVSGGVSPGDRVVTRGNERLRPGSDDGYRQRRERLPDAGGGMLETELHA